MQQKNIALRIVIAIVIGGAVITTSCNIIDPPVESNYILNLSREYGVDHAAGDSTTMFTDTINLSNENSGFAARQDRITTLWYINPTVDVVRFVAADTLYIGAVRVEIGGGAYVGFDTLASISVIPYTIGETGILSLQPHAIGTANNLISHAPHLFLLHTFLRTGQPIDSLRIRITYAINVAYLN